MRWLRAKRVPLVRHALSIFARLRNLTFNAPTLRHRKMKLAMCRPLHGTGTRTCGRGDLGIFMQSSCDTRHELHMVEPGFVHVGTADCHDVDVVLCDERWSAHSRAQWIRTRLCSLGQAREDSHWRRASFDAYTQRCLGEAGSSETRLLTIGVAR